MEADLDECVRFLSRFTSVFWEESWRSWGLRANLQDDFTFWSCFIGGSDLCYDDILGKSVCSWWMAADLGDGFTFLSRVVLVLWEEFGSYWGLKADLDNSLTLGSRFIGGSDPYYDDILGNFWLLLRDGIWFGRRFHVFELFNVSIVGRVWMLLRAKSWG